MVTHKQATQQKLISAFQRSRLIRPAGFRQSRCPGVTYHIFDGSNTCFLTAVQQRKGGDFALAKEAWVWALTRALYSHAPLYVVCVTVFVRKAIRVVPSKAVITALRTAKQPWVAYHADRSPLFWLSAGAVKVVRR